MYFYLLRRCICIDYHCRAISIQRERNKARSCNLRNTKILHYSPEIDAKTDTRDANIYIYM